MWSLVTTILFIGAACAAPPPEDCLTSTGEFRPHETDCSKFYRCHTQGWTEFSCGVGTLFDFPTLTCNWPYAATCYVDDSNDPAATTTTTPAPQCTNTAKVALNDVNCQFFNYCRGGQWYKYKCAAGYRFNPTLNDCYHPSVYPCPTIPCDSNPCQNGGTCSNYGTGFICSCPPTHEGTTCATVVIEDTGAPTGACAAGSLYQQDPADCRQFYACVSNEWRKYACPSESPAFNPTSLVCDYIYNVDCGSRPMNCTLDSRLVSNDIECRNFFRCNSDNKWVEMACPVSTRFNNTIKDCSSTASCPTSMETTTQTATTTTATTTTTGIQCPPYRAGANCDIVCNYPCPPGATIIYPDISDPSNAVFCQNSEITVIPCPAGERWSLSTHRCVSLA